MPARVTLASFLQQEITVITVKQVRYQGKLYSYDTSKSTITLENVRCFGTEGRQTILPVPPREDTFQYVVFNANQIETFQPINSNVHTISDPAIIALTTENAGTARGVRSSPRKSSTGGAGNSVLMRMLDGSHGEIRAVDVNRLMGTQGEEQRQNNNNSNNNNKRRNRRRSQSKQRDDTEQKTKKNQKNKQNSRHVSFKGETSKQSNERRQFTHIPQIPRKALGKRSTSQEPKTAPAPGQFPPRKTPMKFEEEFDFDKALEEFKGLSTNDKPATEKPAEPEGGDTAKPATEDGNANPEQNESVYNQDKSFYDKLTTTTDKDGQQRPSRKEVMQTNKETFGVSYLPSRRFRNRNGVPQRGGNQGHNRNGSRRQQHNSSTIERALRRMLAVH